MVMNLRISSILIEANDITINLYDGQCDDYNLIDNAAILILANELNIKQVIFLGEALMQTKPIVNVAASLKSFGITVITNSNYAFDRLSSMSRRSKYLRALLEYTDVQEAGKCSVQSCI